MLISLIPLEQEGACFPSCLTEVSRQACARYLYDVARELTEDKLVRLYFSNFNVLFF